MKLCQIIVSFGVFVIQTVSSQRRYYIPDDRYSGKSRSQYPSVRRSLQLDSQYAPDPFDSTYPVGAYNENNALAGLGTLRRVPAQSLQETQYSDGLREQAQLYETDRRVWKSPYPSFQAFEDAYPAFSPHMQTKPGHPYNSQRIRIKHTFPANKHVDPPSPQLNEYLPEFGDTPDLNSLLPGFGGANNLAGNRDAFAEMGSVLSQYQTSGSHTGQMLAHLTSQGSQSSQLSKYDSAMPQMSKLQPQFDSAMPQMSKLQPQFDSAMPQMSKLLPQFDEMDSRFMQYAKQPNTVVVEKKIPMPYKVQIEKPYFVEVTKHVAVPVAFPVPKPMPYAVPKYIQVPKYIPVPRYIKMANVQTARSSTATPQYIADQSTSTSQYMATPSTTPTPSPPHQFDHTYFTSDHQPQVSIHPNGVSPPSTEFPSTAPPRPTISNVAYKLALLEQKSRQGGALTLQELQQLMNSEKMSDEPFLIKK